MYKQENKAGVREFIRVILLALLALVVSEFLGGLINFVSKDKINASLSGHIILAVFGVMLVYLVYNHYASVFKYKITKKHIVIEKKTGSRVTEYDLPLTEIQKACIRTGMPKIKGKKLRLSKSFFTNKKSTVLVVGVEEKVIVFEPDDEFIKKLKEYLHD